MKESVLQTANRLQTTEYKEPKSQLLKKQRRLLTAHYSLFTIFSLTLSLLIAFTLFLAKPAFAQTCPNIYPYCMGTKFVQDKLDPIIGACMPYDVTWTFQDCDLDGDGQIAPDLNQNLADISNLMTPCWLLSPTSGGCSRFDLNCDNAVIFMPDVLTWAQNCGKYIGTTPTPTPTTPTPTPCPEAKTCDYATGDLWGYYNIIGTCVWGVIEYNSPQCIPSSCPSTGPVEIGKCFLFGAGRSVENVFGSVGSLASVVIKLLMAVGFLLSFIFLLVGGFKYITSGSDPEAAASARSTITYAIIGLALVILSIAIVKLLGVMLKVNII